MTLAGIEAVARDLAAVVIFTLLVAGVLALFYVGYQKIVADKTASASAAMSFGFLLIIILTISQFKHVKGFGFDAETWDQKQVEAAQLVDQLKGLTKATSRELALVASKIGLWDNGPSNQDLAELANSLNPVLEAGGFDKGQRDELLAPIYDRIEFNYTVDAYSKLYQAFQMQYKVTDASACHPTRELLPPAIDFRQKLCHLNGEIYSRGNPDVSQVISFAQSVPLDNKEDLIKQLLALKTDFEFFKEKHTLRLSQ
jgi:hypothetical protein